MISFSLSSLSETDKIKMLKSNYELNGKNSQKINWSEEGKGQLRDVIKSKSVSYTHLRAHET